MTKDVARRQICMTRRQLAAWIVSAALAVSALSRAATPTTQAATPAWIAKPLASWPPIMLTNRVVDAQKAVGFEGSAGLVRLPNDVVVLMTARHLLNGTKLADFATAFKSWTVVGAPGAPGGLPMKTVAMDTSDTSDFDALVLLPISQQATWPATVLPVRTEPLEVGETVYLVAIPAEGMKVRQTVRRATITKCNADHSVEYAVEGTFKTTGNSGAPVVDAHGRFCAINTAHLNDQTEPGKMLLSGLDVSEVLRHIKLPPGIKPLVLPDVPPATTGGQTAGGPPASGPEADADKLLAMADIGAQMGMPANQVNDLLQQVIDKYPNTTAAKTAKAKLAGK